MRGLIVVAMMIGGCVPPASWTNLPEEDRQAWQRCVNVVSNTRCGSTVAEQDMVYRGVCGRELATTYSEQPSPESRKRWLLANGCPPSMVRPEAY